MTFGCPSDSLIGRINAELNSVDNSRWHIRFITIRTKTITIDFPGSRHGDSKLISELGYQKIVLVELHLFI